MTQMLQFWKLKKIIAIVTTVSLFMMIFTPGLPASVKENTAGTFSVDGVFENLNVIKPCFGKITGITDSFADITVVNIQDLHCHKQTQLNISEIINQISKKFALKYVYLEGGYGNINIEWINSISDNSFKNRIADKMIEEGYLSAGEYFAVKNNRPDILKGLDEKNIHEENLKRLAKIIEKQAEYKKIEAEIDRELKILNSQYLNSQNRRFTKHLKNYYTGNLDNVKFYRLLFKYALKINKNPQKYDNITAIKTEDYPNISIYLGLSKQYRGLNLKLVNSEMKILAGFLKNRLPYASYKKLLTATDNFKDTEILFEFLTKMPEEYSFDLKTKYAHLSKFFEIKTANSRINPIELVKEERTLIKQIRTALSKNSIEQEIAFLTDFSKYFKNYLSYALAYSDWQYFKSGFGKFYEIYSKYAVTDRIKYLKQDIVELDKYYDLNEKRNSIFVLNILKDIRLSEIKSRANSRTPEEMLKQSKQVFIAVTGGFHSEELSKMLGEKRVNTIIITPNVTDKTEYAKIRYGEILKMQKEIKHNALALRLASCSSSKDQQIIFTKTAMNLLGETNLSETVAKLNRYGLKIQNLGITQKDIDSQNEKIQIKTMQIEFILSKIMYLILSPSMSLNPKESIDKALVSLFEVLVMHGFFFSRGFVPEIEEAQTAEKSSLFEKFDALVLSRFPPALQRAAAAAAFKNKTVRKPLIPKIKKIVKQAFISFILKKETAPKLKKPSRFKSMLFAILPGALKLNAIDTRLKILGTSVEESKETLKTYGITQTPQITDISMQKTVISKTAANLALFKSKLEEINGLKSEIEELKSITAAAQHFIHGEKTDKKLKETKDLLDSTERQFNLLFNIFLFSLSEIYTDKKTKEHAVKVTKYAQIISKYLDKKSKNSFAPYFDYYMMIAAVLHDIGKNAIPDSILNKPGSLTKEEMEVMQTHAEIGAEIINSAGFEHFSFGARYHQEKYNGQGYPRRLSGKEIPLMASVMTLADSFDAMISERSYKKAMPRYVAIGKIKIDEGTYFAPLVVRTFMKAVLNGEFPSLSKEETDILTKPSDYNTDGFVMEHIVKNLLSVYKKEREFLVTPFDFEKKTYISPKNINLIRKNIGKKFGIFSTAFKIALKNFPNSVVKEFGLFLNADSGKYGTGFSSIFLAHSIPFAESSLNLSETLKSFILVAAGSHIIKHTIINYKFIKSTGLKQAVEKFGESATIDEYGRVYVPPVLIVSDIEQIDPLKRKNTGLKINGRTLWQLESGFLAYGAENASLAEVSETIPAETIKREIEKQLRKKARNIEIVADTVITSDSASNSITFEKYATVIKNSEFDKRTGSAQDEYLDSVMEARTAVAVAQGKKILVSLEKINDRNLLLNKLSVGKARKIISAAQYEVLKSQNKNIDRDFVELRKKGIKIYIRLKDAALSGQYSVRGFSGCIVGDMLTDYYSHDSVKVKIIDDYRHTTLNYLERLMTTSPEPVVIDIRILENVFKLNRDILSSYDMLNFLAGSIRSTFKISDLTPLDAKETAYGINFDKIPGIEKENAEKFAVATDEDLIDYSMLKRILKLSGNDTVSILFQELSGNPQAQKAFINAVRERILAKALLKEKGKSYGLKDKKLEILLGKLVIEQFKSSGTTPVEIPHDFIGSEANMIRFIGRLQKNIEEINVLAAEENDETAKTGLLKEKETAVNMIIELIVIYADENKSKRISKIQNLNDARNYRAMLSAA